MCEKKDEMIYILKAEFGGETRYKIGFTRGSAVARMKQIQVACPVNLELIKELRGDQSDELKLHGYLSCLRLHGEWFKHGSLIEGILRIPDGNSAFKNSEWVVENGKYLRKFKTEIKTGDRIMGKGTVA